MYVCICVFVGQDWVSHTLRRENSHQGWEADSAAPCKSRFFLLGLNLLCAVRRPPTGEPAEVRPSSSSPVRRGELEGEGPSKPHLCRKHLWPGAGAPPGARLGLQIEPPSVKAEALRGDSSSPPYLQPRRPPPPALLRMLGAGKKPRPQEPLQGGRATPPRCPDGGPGWRARRGRGPAATQLCARTVSCSAEESQRFFLRALGFAGLGRLAGTRGCIGPLHRSARVGGLLHFSWPAWLQQRSSRFATQNHFSSLLAATRSI